mmetsp:Transcript_12347/g.35302  ORF Transcript_12347/g.35302 Transcript_12347/m.35302 type:complete len:469 (-) Transcript_12347:82-1488(-)
MSETNSTLPEGAYPIEGLLYYGGQWKYGHGKSFAIVTSVSAILSTVFSSLLVAMVLRSKDRLGTAYHRLLMGMAVGDILFSLPHCLFHAMVPKDMDWLIWGAKGNQATCTLNGFVIRVGATLSLFYVCSLILYYLAKVKFSKTDMYIRSKLEPFLHGVPILAALAQGIIGLVNQNYNTTGAGVCTLAPIYEPGHCVGYEDGDIRPGFEIPCGRGKQEALYRWFSFVVFMIPPVVIVIAFAMIYGAVRQQEKTIGRYGAGALNVSSVRTANDPPVGDSASSSGTSRSGFQKMSSLFGSACKSVKGVKGAVLGSRDVSFSNANANGSNSRAVMHRAFAYIMAYFVTWIWAVVGEFMNLADADIPLAYNYTWTILVPMQGMFNFLVFIHPKVKKLKNDEDLSWPRAFARALSTGLDIKCTSMKKSRPAADAMRRRTPRQLLTACTVSSRRGTGSVMDDSFVAEDEEAESEA